MHTEVDSLAEDIPAVVDNIVEDRVVVVPEDFLEAWEKRP